MKPSVPTYERELVLRENGNEMRFPHSFLDEVGPGTFLRLHDRDWIVVEVQDGETPSVICRPAAES